MLKLEFDFALGPGREPLPDYLGGVLHGYVEGAVKNHDPHILPVLRPGGADGIAHFMILPPPMTITVEGALRFARRLKLMGVDEALKSAGAQEGDIIMINDYQFLYRE